MTEVVKLHLRFSLLSKESPLYGSIQPGDTVLSLYGCQVYNKQDWNNCISKTLNTPQHGYCTDMLTITRKNSSQGEDIHVYLSTIDLSAYAGNHHSSVGEGVVQTATGKYLRRNELPLPLG